MQPVVRQGLQDWNVSRFKRRSRAKRIDRQLRSKGRRPMKEEREEKVRRTNVEAAAAGGEGIRGRKTLHARVEALISKQACTRRDGANRGARSRLPDHLDLWSC